MPYKTNLAPLETICAVEANMCRKRQVCAVRGEFVPWEANFCEMSNLCHVRRTCALKRPIYVT